MTSEKATSPSKNETRNRKSKGKTASADEIPEDFLVQPRPLPVYFFWSLAAALVAVCSYLGARVVLALHSLFVFAGPIPGVLPPGVLDSTHSQAVFFAVFCLVAFGLCAKHVKKHAAHYLAVDPAERLRVAGGKEGAPYHPALQIAGTGFEA